MKRRSLADHIELGEMIKGLQKQFSLIQAKIGLMFPTRSKCSNLNNKLQKSIGDLRNELDNIVAEEHDIGGFSKVYYGEPPDDISILHYGKTIEEKTKQKVTLVIEYEMGEYDDDPGVDLEVWREVFHQTNVFTCDMEIVGVKIEEVSSS